MKLFIILSAFVIGIYANAQSGYMVLKKKNHTVNRYYAGSFIQFYTTENFFIEGFIDKFKDDSVFIKLASNKMVNTAFGTKQELVYKGYYKVHLKNIGLIPQKKMSAAGIGNLLLQIAVLGTAVVAVNNINIADANTRYIIQYTSAIGISFLVANAAIFPQRKKQGIALGKKYNLEIYSF